MRLLTVRHITVYRYSQPVKLGEHRMMFRPRESHDLRLLKTKLEITPRPAHLRLLHDVFDNSVAIVTFDGVTAELRFESVVTLQHFETTMPDYALEEFAEHYPFSYSDEDLPNLARALVRHYPSEEAKQWVTKFLDVSGTTPTMNLLRAVTLAIKQDFVYTRRSEKGVQNPTETLHTRRGSCRDFAVLMMEALRSLGLAARFVSGYIFVPGIDAATVTGRGRHPCLDAGLSPRRWLDRFRSNQQHRRKSQPDPRRRRVGPQTCSAVMGYILRDGRVISWHGRNSHRD